MRVISKGCQRVQCPRCGSLLEYEWKDIHNWGEKDETYTVTCPECAKLIDVDPIILPNSNYFTGYCVNNGTSMSTITLGEPYCNGFDMFQRDALCASKAATISAADVSVATLSAADANIIEA